MTESQAATAVAGNPTLSALMGSPMPVIWHADDGEILGVSAAFEEATGYPESELSTIEDWVKVAHGEHDAHPALVATESLYAVDGVARRGGAHRIRCKGGSVRVWDFYSSPLNSLPDGRRTAACVAVDVTQGARSRREASRRLRALRVLGACNQTLLRAADEATLLRDVCDVVTRQGGYRMAWVGYVRHGRQPSIRPAACSGAELGYLNEISHPLEKGAVGPVVTAVRERRHVSVPDIESAASHPWRDEALGRHYRSALFLPLLIGGHAGAILCIYSARPNAFTADEVGLLGELAADISFALEDVRSRQRLAETQRELALANERLSRQLKDLAMAIGRAVDARDPYLGGHQEEAAQVATAIAREMGMSENYISAVEMSALLHDVGKLTVPSEILNQPGKLSPEHFAVVKMHCESGYRILEGVDFPWPVAEIILQHHERLDGSGYPRGLKGDEILPAARILAVADVIEAMRSHRPYRPALAMDEVMAELRTEGKYDPCVVDAVERIWRREAVFAAGEGE